MLTIKNCSKTSKNTLFHYLQRLRNYANQVNKEIMTLNKVISMYQLVICINVFLVYEHFEGYILYGTLI